MIDDFEDFDFKEEPNKTNKYLIFFIIGMTGVCYMIYDIITKKQNK
jgi:hypothetical protein